MKPKVVSQLTSNAGMSRLGGAASRGSTPVAKTQGSGFAAMENALLKSGVKTTAQAKRVTGGGASRQFNTKASGGDVAGSMPKSNKAIGANPTILASLMRNQVSGKVGQ